MAGTAASGRYDHIDALRAIAALLVVWRHAEGILLVDRTTEFAKLVFSFIDPGRAGVVLFFAISGFVIPSSLRGKLTDGTRNFVIRRFFRLYPAYWLSIPIGWLAIYWLGGEQFASREIVANATMLQTFFGISDVIGVYWTLAIELVFYSICLTLFWLGIAHRSITFCAFTALTALGAWGYAKVSHYVLSVELGSIPSPSFLYNVGHYLVQNPSNLWGDSRYLWLVFLSVMGLGALIRFWHDRRAGSFDKIIILLAVGCWLIWFLIVPIELYLRGVLSRVDVCTYLCHSIPVVAFFVLSLCWKIKWRLLSYIGLVSYSMYLFHAAIFYPLHYFLRKHPEFVLNSLPAPALMVGAVLLSAGAAAMIFTFIERPAIDLSRRLTNFRTGGLPKAVEGAADTSTECVLQSIRIR